MKEQNPDNIDVDRRNLLKVAATGVAAVTMGASLPAPSTSYSSLPTRNAISAASPRA
jgi:hypothetical protein